MTRSRTSSDPWYGSGRLWMWVWIWVFVSSVVWAVLTFAIPTLRNSVLNVVLLSLYAIVLTAAGGIQTTLTMRKADTQDPL